MNSALRISVVIAWLMLAVTVSPSHGDGMLCPTLKPLIASFINQLSADSVNEITPHVEALASIVKGNDMYNFFHNVEEECQIYQNKLGNSEQSTIPKEKNEGKIEESQKNEGSVSYSEKRPLKAENDVSKKVNETSRKEEAANKHLADSGSEGASEANKAPNAKKRLTLRDLPKGVTKRFKMNNIEVVLLRQGDTLNVVTRKPEEQPQKQPLVDLAGKDGAQSVKAFVDALTAPEEKLE